MSTTDRGRSSVHGVTGQRDARAGNRCGPACATPTPSQAHCPTCHRTFSGVTGFDRHRRDGACLDPATLGMYERGGVWRRPPDERASRLWNRSADAS